MPLTSEESRVLACLIEKEATVPDSYPLTLNALRLACNQATNRHPIVAYEDRAVEAALLSLKSIGLVRFVFPSHGGRTVRYRQTADERWRLSPAELGALSVLVLRGPQTTAEIRTRAERIAGGASQSEVEEALDALAGRSPEPLAVRLERHPGERDQRWSDLLTGKVPDIAPLVELSAEQPDVTSDAASLASGELGDDLDDLAGEVAALRARLDRLELLLGLDDHTT
ncbi:MAG: YceH family protein [Actinomycetota bacterium]|nr:YceH family protein [Actinomycetota bacterium]